MNIEVSQISQAKFWLTKAIPVKYHNLREYDGHIMMQGKLNGPKNMAFVLAKNFLFIDSLQFMTSGLKKLVQILPNDNFVYFPQEFCGKQLELVKQKGINQFEHVNSFENIDEAKLLTRERGLLFLTSWES